MKNMPGENKKINYTSIYCTAHMCNVSSVDANIRTPSWTMKMIRHPPIYVNMQMCVHIAFLGDV